MQIYALTPSGDFVEQSSLPNRETVCALGLFDGVHLGHAMLLKQTCALAEAYGALPIVYTFSDGSYKANEQLTTVQERLSLFGKAGIRYAVTASFEAVCDLSPAEFVCRILIDHLQVCCAVCGENYRFGKAGVGTAQFLQELLSQRGKDCKIVPPVCFSLQREDGICLPAQALAQYGGCSLGKATVSASVIREMLRNGKVDWAQALLGRPYAVCAKVVHGKAIGRTLGFPTANQNYPAKKVPLPGGVYLCRARLSKGEPFGGVCNIGCNPSVEGGTLWHMETHLLTDDNLDLYEKQLQVEFLLRLRGEQTFSDLEQLKGAIAENVAQARAYFHR